MNLFLSPSLSQSALQLLFSACYSWKMDRWAPAGTYLSGKEQGPVWCAGLKKKKNNEKHKIKPLLKLRSCHCCQWLDGFWMQEGVF